MAKEIEAKIYDALGIDPSLVGERPSDFDSVDEPAPGAIDKAA